LGGIPPDYTDRANRETFLVVQIETPLAVKNVEAIAASEGVDVLFLDLVISRFGSAAKRRSKTPNCDLQLRKQSQRAPSTARRGLSHCQP